MLFGADYYPEHWEKDRWSIDAKLMKEAGINVVRVGEFAWSKFEPKEGVYDFAWLDEAINILVKEGVKVILGTPTATPPKWLMDKYPDIYPIDREGRVRGFGNRHHRCHNNPTYREYAKKIARKMAEHYKGNDNIVGWQIDNEIGCHDTTRCYCDHCLEAFKQWLKKKYKNIDELNEAWGTIFWSQTYGSFDEVILPRFSVVERQAIHGFSPGMMLDYDRFASDSAVDYQNIQIEEIRKFSNATITHNTMQDVVFTDIDYYDLGKELDIVSIDNYPSPVMHMCSDMKKFHHYVSVCLAITRGIKDKNFWVMEQQSGRPGWGAYFGKHMPGQLRLWTYQAVAHGAEGIVYFRWRPCTYGAEQYWLGILDHDGIPRKRYSEIQKTGSELQKVSSLIEGSTIQSEVAMIKDYDNVWAHEICTHSPKFKNKDLFYQYYANLNGNHVDVDITNIKRDLSKYKVAFAPAFNLMDDTMKAIFEEYVENGGHLVITFLSGTRNTDNSITIKTFPGYFRELAGIEVEDVDPLVREMKITGNIIGEGTATLWCDEITLKEAEALASFHGGLFNDKPAITVNTYGKGKVYYVGCQLDDESNNKLVQHILTQAGVKANLSQVYEGVEAVKKIKDGKEYMMILNHNFTPVTVELEGKYNELITGVEVDNKITLEPLGVAMITK